MLAYDPLGSAVPPAHSTPLGAELYQRFYAEVALSQLREWLPGQPSRLLDLSGADGRFGAVAAEAGHDVVHVVEPGTAEAVRTVGTVGAYGEGRTVQADPMTLAGLADAAFDGIIAEGRMLSRCLATEHALEGVGRVLKPGGALLLCVDSLLAGMARLADQERWAELADLPLADVVLVPSSDGTISRCFWPEEVRALLTEAGFDVEWVRPRTVLSADAVERALLAEPEQLRRLVRTETALAAEREGDAHGVHLVASARKR